jgi:orotidine-5'-phosphate decarboxylase
VALDVESAADALVMARRVARWAGTFKIGPSHVLEGGPAFIQELKALGRKVFLDLKLYDIPETVARACRQAARGGVDYLTVHVSGGSRMLAAARDAVRSSSSGNGRVRLLGVTVLTSFDAAQLAKEWKLQETVEERVVLWAGLARDEALDGIVCSPLELAALKSHLGPGMLAVVPGIRSASDPKGDQSRTMSAAEAVARGADLIVVGRPIIASPDPERAASEIVSQIEEGNA